jgi:hypothetical protein
MKHIAKILVVALGLIPTLAFADPSNEICPAGQTCEFKLNNQSGRDVAFVGFEKSFIYKCSFDLIEGSVAVDNPRPEASGMKTSVASFRLSTTGIVDTREMVVPQGNMSVYFHGDSYYPISRIRVSCVKSAQ